MLPTRRRKPKPTRHVAPPVPDDLDVEVIMADGGVIAILSHPVSPNDETIVREELTEAERSIAALARAGLSDRAIAAVRGVTRSTVTKQLAEVFRKLGVRSRRELIARAMPGPSTPR